MTAVKEEALRFAKDFIGEVFTSGNDVLRKSPVRRATWEVVRTDEKTLITSIGSVRYEKTLFKNKKSGERRYLVDAAMDIDSHERISEDAVAQMLEESVQTCYRKGGDMLELARYQKQVLPKAVGEEELVLSAGQMYHDEVNRNPKWAKYAERMQVQVSPQIKKMLAIGMHDFIWTLR
ncbi:MAG: UPF0236 family protein [Lachnospiraceae bacterium]|nr:UPF0236 family protein [Lachnospiraceae bacterium]